MFKNNSVIYHQLDKLSLQFGIRPKAKSCNIDREKRFPDGFQGGVVISADFELGWAFRYSKTNPNPEKMAKQTRDNFSFLLKTIDEYNIPITWATVGHLFLEKCSKGDHDWMRRIPHFDDHWKFTSGDWYDHDPYSNYKKSPYWYAPDLIEKILKSKVNHEIGCHTFSHIDFSDKNCPPDVAEDEIKACIEAAKPFGIEFKSIVFPGGTYGNIEILKKYGFKVYRRNLREKLSYPYKDNEGMIVTHSTQMIGISNPSWNADYYIFRYKKMIDKAIKTGTICHLWFHPSDISLRKILPEILLYAKKLNDKNRLWIGKMEELQDLID